MHSANSTGCRLTTLSFGNGSDELIHLFGVAYLDPGDGLMMGQPSFVRYIASAQLNQATLQAIPLTPDYRHDLEAMADAITERTKLVYLANPNNPTGTIVSRAELERFLERLPDHVLVILDEAYFEYVDHPDYPNGLDYVRAGRNVVVFRTFSKAYGLAGLRIGYAVGRPELLDPIERVREPFNVNTLAQVAAAAALTRPSACRPHSRAESRGAANVQRGVRAAGAALCTLAGELPAHRDWRPLRPSAAATAPARDTGTHG
jgi:histidinol-phosphate aminotransferase